MNVRLPLPLHPDQRAEARRERLLDRQLEMLDQLAQVGLDIAVAIGGQVAVQPDDAPADLPTLNTAATAYARAARAVRMTLALQSRLVNVDEAPSKSKTPEQPTKIRVSWMSDPVKARAEQRQRVQRLVRRVAEGAGMDHEACERLADAAEVRLHEDEDIHGDLSDRPVSEILAHICRDLGLAPDWANLANEGWAQEEIETGDPGAPLAEWIAGRWPTPPPSRPQQAHPPPLVPAKAGI